VTVADVLVAPGGAIVRRARPGDAPAIAAILCRALEAKLRPAFGRRLLPAMNALIAEELRRPRTAYWVAERQGRVLGGVRLEFGRTPGAPTFTRTVARACGWWTALRATLVLSGLGLSSIAPDQALVEELAVEPEARRQGLATELLARCEDEARRRGRHRLSLQVTADNAPALALYGAAGFAVVRRRRWWARRALFGAPGAVFMEKRLGAALNRR
jgi:ribosomal protein S18 acetylase RimI-like enzyme